MTDTIRGLYRTAGKACVTDDMMAFDISETEYRECAYTPAYDILPTKAVYAAGRLAKPKRRGRAR
jgi:hypothetical protein